MLAEGVSVRFRGRRVIRFNRATVFFQHPIQAVVKCLKFHDAIVLTHAQPVPVERVRHDVAGWMLHLHQPVFSVPRVGRQVAARLFDGQLVAIGVVRVRGRAGDIRGVQQSVGTVIGQRRDIQGHRFRLRQAIPGGVKHQTAGTGRAGEIVGQLTNEVIRPGADFGSADHAAGAIADTVKHIVVITERRAQAGLMHHAGHATGRIIDHAAADTVSMRDLRAATGGVIAQSCRFAVHTLQSLQSLYRVPAVGRQSQSRDTAYQPLSELVITDGDGTAQRTLFFRPPVDVIIDRRVTPCGVMQQCAIAHSIVDLRDTRSVLILSQRFPADFVIRVRGSLAAGIRPHRAATIGIILKRVCLQQRIGDRQFPADFVVRVRRDL